MTDSEELAQDRTDWAEDRTLLANERTFAAWMRTGMASVALALGLRALFGPFEPTWVPKAVASLFIAAAVLIFVLAWVSARKALSRLDDHSISRQPLKQLNIVALALGTAAIVTGAILLLL